ncbi:zinc finger protein [Teratosphaeria destructans]|uniref:Zinc finger protein n=1 Tax=Teratosphaeria destructans TaxID=418781 RepID=A0A9W7SIQ2_9PEZI|nr:zinc finger protein [Teratosphaeria destructans]
MPPATNLSPKRPPSPPAKPVEPSSVPIPTGPSRQTTQANIATPGELCQKGYARMNDFEAHEGSYDHQHRKRLKEMKQLTKDPNAASKAERERRANEEAGLKTLNLNHLSSGGAAPPAKKKPVFKSTLQPQHPASLPPHHDDDDDDDAADLEAAYAADPAQARTNAWEAERYDPRFPSAGFRVVVDPRRAVALVGTEGWEGYVRRAVERLGREGRVDEGILGGV